MDEELRQILDELALTVAEAAADEVAEGLANGVLPGGDGMPLTADGEPRGYNTGHLAEGLTAELVGDGEAVVLVPPDRDGAPDLVWPGATDPFPQGGIEESRLVEALEQMAERIAVRMAEAIEEAAEVT